VTDAPAIREDTMIYREPIDGSENVQDIWGSQVEVKVVDAPEVAAFLAEGWVTNPEHIKNPPKAPVAKDDPRIAELEAEVATLRGALKSADEMIVKLQGDLKAATDLADAESKAKDEALAKLADAGKTTTADQSAKPTLGVKAK